MDEEPDLLWKKEKKKSIIDSRVWANPSVEAAALLEIKLATKR